MARKILDLPNGWELHADDERRPILVHRDGRRLEPKDAAFEADAQELYRALKLEEDRVGLLRPGAENTNEWITIWSARVVLGDFFNRKVSGMDDVDADRILHEETEKAVNREKLERYRLWN